ncbi:Uncharacterised protein [Vibrio cholerae]|nr:Uncharacterised protein [Vibrio cholerae]CSD26526.1 Uncharacterised protein [Vibrio cholerae]
MPKLALVFELMHRITKWKAVIADTHQFSPRRRLTQTLPALINWGKSR